MTLKYALAAALVVGFAGAAYAANASQFGKQAYPSEDEVNIDLKVVCDNS
jgi:hypothetical protein